MTHKEKYYSYLNSEEWSQKRKQLIELRGKVCEKCKKDLRNRRIDVHHKTYENIFNEKLEDLEVLCRECHRKEHNIYEAFRYIKASKNYFKGSKFIEVKPITKKEKQQKSFSRLSKVKREEEANYLLKKRKLIRSLHKQGIKEVDGNKLYFYDLKFLLKLC